jgi:4-hydroxy-2-oxoheptanedioate aldolase
MRRDARSVLHVGSDEWVAALAGSVVALMIEKKEALEDLDAILSVPGIDMVQFGPSDYAMGMGWARPRDAGRLREAEEHVIATALRHGLAPRAEPGGAGQIERYLELGVRHFCMGHDVRILADWFRDEGARARELLAHAAEQPGTA